MPLEHLIKKGRRGKAKHERLLRDTLEDLELQGFKVLDLEGKSPTMIAADGKKFIAIKIFKKTYTKGHGWNQHGSQKQTLKKYDMFDDVILEYYKHGEETLRDKIDAIQKKYEADGYRAVYMQLKSPDGIAYKDGKLYAVEVMGINHREFINTKTGNQCMRNEKRWSEGSKRMIYDMFDDVIIKTFKYHT